ncbi:GNAT family N-acetyltransferase family protein [Gelidibacter gilvus]|uniref:GNAT family N-acetyltransferase n=1 Tax=Gelidibacter gilvus TaxID=59602 RepID=A0A4Q0XDJ6_9FLAO|nr:GNAT family N-acetyltransferase [Gelidibacter gilvus]RXJ46031.1 GNAT family N-acetyltransferase [Gelidibacter gilvus]
MSVKHYQKENLKFSFIHDLIVSVNHHFVPILSSELDLYEYAKKLQKNANCLIIEEENELLAFMFYYIVSPIEPSVYITLVCSLKPGGGAEIYNELINLVSPKVVKLEVDRENLRAFSFYKKLGFLVDSESIHDSKLILKHQLK